MRGQTVHRVLKAEYKSINASFDPTRNLTDTILNRKVENINARGVMKKVVK